MKSSDERKLQENEKAACTHPMTKSLKLSYEFIN